MSNRDAPLRSIDKMKAPSSISSIERAFFKSAYPASNPIYLTDPRMPSTKLFWSAKKSSSVGIVHNETASMTMP